MEWTQDFRVNVDYIDQQHKQIVAYISEAEELLAKHKTGIKIPKQQILSLVSQLASYTSTHFKDEETMMKRHNLSNFDRHLTLHSNLLSQVQVLSSKVEQHGAEVLPILVKFLVDWLKSHILGVDKTYSKIIGKREAP